MSLQIPQLEMAGNQDQSFKVEGYCGKSFNVVSQPAQNFLLASSPLVGFLSQISPCTLNATCIVFQWLIQRCKSC